jgi:hypothetical protein
VTEKYYLEENKLMTGDEFYIVLEAETDPYNGICYYSLHRYWVCSMNGTFLIPLPFQGKVTKIIFTLKELAFMIPAKLWCLSFTRPIAIPCNEYVCAIAQCYIIGLVRTKLGVVKQLPQELVDHILKFYIH